jgi:predicted acyltransferase
MMLEGFRWNRSIPRVGSIFSTIVSVLLGVLVGHANGIRGSGSSIFWGARQIAAGELVFSIWTPINKQLWTSSFVA